MPEPEDRHERTAGDEADLEPAVGVRRADAGRGDVVGEQPRPSLDVAGEAEDELGGRRDVDPDRAPHPVARAADGRRTRDPTPRRADLDEPDRSPSSSAREPPRGVGRAVDLVAEAAADDPHVVQHAEEVEVGPVRGARSRDRRARRRRRPTRSRRSARSPPRARGGRRRPDARRTRPRRPGSVHAPTSTSIGRQPARRIRPSSSRQRA